MSIPDIPPSCSENTAHEPLAATLPEILRRRAEETPQRPAYAFLEDGENESERVSFAELWQRVRAMAAEIHARTPHDARVLLLLPTGIDYIAAFLACLEAGRVAVPAYPPAPQRASRVRSIGADAQPALVLVPQARLEATRRGLLEIDALAECDWIPIEDLGQLGGDAWSGGPSKPEGLAYLQYSSGSTSAPKGARITHANLIHNTGCISSIFACDHSSTWVSWLPLFHDMGLVGATLVPLYAGALGVVMPSVAFLQKPARWLRAVERYAAHITGAPNFAYDLCTRKVTVDESAGLDLSSLRVAFNGAEPVRAETLTAFALRFGPHGLRSDAFRPAYGMAESTLAVSTASAVKTRQVSAAALEAGGSDEARPGEPARVIVSCGPPCAPGLRIVDPDALCEVGPGQVGEIWLRSPSVADGYWSRPEVNGEVFGARLRGTGEGPFLRSGDLGFVVDGELYVTGRLKDLIIVHGANHYPQDIEATVQRAHPALKPGAGAAFAVDDGGAERLVVVQEVEREALSRLHAAAVGETVRAAVLREHELELAVLVLVKPGGVPKTSSGKLQRNETRRRFQAGDLPVVGESRPETARAGLWERLETAARADVVRDVLVRGTQGLSLGALLREAEHTAGRLRAAGVRPGTTVGLLADNDPATLSALLACWRLGTTTLLAGVDGTGIESVAARLRDADAPLVVARSRRSHDERLAGLRVLALDHATPTPGDGHAAPAPTPVPAGTNGSRLVVHAAGGARELVLGEQELRRYVERFGARLRERDHTLVCALKDPDGLAALEWLATLALGGRVVFVPEPRTAARGAGQVDFSLMFFSANEAELGDDKYRLFIEAARFADRHGFKAIWTPERHFHAFGGLYPNPSVLSAALAMITDRIRLRPGSVVLPLHHPVRVAEEWSVVDNLSGGRVDMAFARGWNANDFVFAPHNFENSREVMFRDIETVRRLWRGETLTFPNGHGQPTEVRLHPLPRQKELNIWITCSGGPERFAETGAAGVNVFTALLFQSAEELAAKLALYRRARADHGHDPEAGQVTVMLHTFVGADEESVRAAVREPFIEYLRTSVDLWRNEWSQLGSLDETRRRQVLEFAFERYYRASALFGTPAACLAHVEELRDSGVDEIACLIDFGAPQHDVLASLAHLDELRRSFSGESGHDGPAERLRASLEACAAAAVQCTPDDARALGAGGTGRCSLRLVQGTLPPSANAEAGALLSVGERAALLTGTPTAVAVRSRAARRAGTVAPSERDLVRQVCGLAQGHVASVLNVAADDLARDCSFSQLGIDSLKGVEIMARLGSELGLTLSPTLLFEFPTVTKLGEHLVAEHRAAVATRFTPRTAEPAPVAEATEVQP